MKNSNNNYNKSSGKFVAFWESTSKMFALNMSNHFSGVSFWMGNIIMPVIFILSTGVLFPVTFAFTWALFLSISISSFSSFGTLFFTFRRSTLNKNMEMTSVSSASTYFSILISMLTITFITLVVLMGATVGLTMGDILNKAFFFVKDPAAFEYINFKEVNYSMIATYWVMSTMIYFAMSFVIMQYVKSQKTYFIIMFTYILASLFFGGLMSLTMTVDDDPLSATYNQAVFITDNYYTYTSNPELYHKYIPGSLDAWMLAKPIWIFGQFFPHYQLNQLASVSLLTGTHFGDIAGPLSKWGNISLLTAKDFPLLYYKFMPLVQFVFYIMVGSFSTFNEN